MTTTQWETVRSGDGSLTFHRAVVEGRHVSLNMPGLAYICGTAWSANRSGHPTFFGHTRADLRAYYEREGITLPELPEEWCPEPVKEPDADGWIPWGGGECPVPAETKVKARLRNETVATVPASSLWWSHHHNSADIIAYRVISSPEPAEKPDADTGVVQTPTTHDRLLNLATRMWLSDKPASYYAGELRDLARELDGGAK